MIIWDTLVLQPLLNVLLALSSMMGGSFGMAIIVLTIIVNAALTPLTQRQTKSTKAMQEIQPKMQALQQKYKRDPQKMQREISALYKEAGVSPLGCVWPMLVQLPIWIGIYQSIIKALAATPENLLALSQNIYPWTLVQRAVPAEQDFLWLNLAQPDGYMILAVLVGATMWLQQKMVTPPATDPKQKQMTQMMTTMMPLMFGVFTLQFPSGLALYWVMSSVVRIAIQYYTGGGWGYLRAPPLSMQPPPMPRQPGK